MKPHPIIFGHQLPGNCQTRERPVRASAAFPDCLGAADFGRLIPDRPHLGIRIWRVNGNNGSAAMDRAWDVAADGRRD